MISARISGSLGVLVEEAQPERRLGRSDPVCFRSLRFPTYLISKRSLRRSIFSFLCVMGAHQGAFMPRHSGSSSHSTLIPAHQPVIQAPLYYYLYFPLHRPWTRTHREVDLRTDIWLSGRASGRGEAGAETGVAASLCLFPFSPVPTYRISSGR